MPSGSGLEHPMGSKSIRQLPEKTTLSEDDPIWDSLIIVPAVGDDRLLAYNERPPTRRPSEVHSPAPPSVYNERPPTRRPSEVHSPAPPSVYNERPPTRRPSEVHSPAPPSVYHEGPATRRPSEVHSPAPPSVYHEGPATRRPSEVHSPAPPSVYHEGPPTRWPSEVPSPTPLNLLSLEAVLPDEDVSMNPPSPAVYVECGASGGSTPSTRSICSEKRKALCRTKRPTAALTDEQISSALCLLGSSSESSDDEEEASVPRFVPRAVQMFFEIDDDIEVAQTRAHVDLQWPPAALLPDVEVPVPLQVIATSEHAEVGQPQLEATINGHLPNGPTDKFNFEWKGFPTLPTPPELRREPFEHRLSGPTASYITPYDAFTAIWDRDIMSKIVSETNDYAQLLAKILLKENKMCHSSRITQWQDTNIDELFVFYAIILAMGIVNKTDLTEYWSISQDITSTSNFGLKMSVSRFKLLSRCLHFSSARTPGLQLMTNAEAKLFKVQPIVEHLNRKFSTLYNLGQNVALDESLTMWKGWLNIKQFIHNKAASAGIKTYEICESQSGYLWRFEVHTGPHEPSHSEGPISGVIPALVLRLVRGLEHKGHTLWMDNYYNSPALARELKTLGFDCVGTLRTDRQLVPDQLANLKKQQMAPGQVVGCTSGDVDLVVWRDKNRVALISTYHGLATTMCGQSSKPTIVHDYNVCMGGVDRKDQMLSMYPIERKRTNVWYKKFFKRLLNVSVLNAYVLYKADHDIKHRCFRKTLMNQILEKHTKRPARSYAVAIDVRQHFPALYDFVAAAPGKRSERHRAKCRVCSKRVHSYCPVCKVALCPFVCFSTFEHNLENSSDIH